MQCNTTSKFWNICSSAHNLIAINEGDDFTNKIINIDPIKLELEFGKESTYLDVPSFFFQLGFFLNFRLSDFHMKAEYCHTKLWVVNPSLDLLTMASKITSDTDPFGVLKEACRNIKSSW